MEGAGAPGKFQVLVDGKPLADTFGTKGAAWHWQDGGTVELPAGDVTLALHDLTGFEGRCDAIVLVGRRRASRRPTQIPRWPPSAASCWACPTSRKTAGEFDLVVVGGGIAGTCAALSAARLGLKVALVQDRPVLGGNNSSEVRVWLAGETNFAALSAHRRRGHGTRPEGRAHYGPTNRGELYEDEKKLALVAAEKNITLLLNHRANGVEMDGERIAPSSPRT